MTIAVLWSAMPVLSSCRQASVNPDPTTPRRSGLAQLLGRLRVDDGSNRDA